MGTLLKRLIKNTAIIFFGLLFSTSIGFAQKGFNLSIESSLLSSGITHQKTMSLSGLDKSFTLGYKYGFEVGYHFNDKWGLYTGISLMSLGQKYANDESVNNWTLKVDKLEAEIDLHYLRIPLMYQYQGKGNKVKFIGGAGISIAILTKGNYTFQVNGKDLYPVFGNPVRDTIEGLIIDGVVVQEEDSINNTTRIIGDQYVLFHSGSDPSDTFAKLDVMIELEAGLKFSLGKTYSMDLMADFAYGLNNIYEYTRSFEGSPSSHNIYGGIKLRFGVDALWDNKEIN